MIISGSIQTASEINRKAYKRKRVNLFSLFLLVLLLTQSVIVKSYAETAAVQESTAAYVVMNADTGEVLYSKNENAILAPASITKVLTVLVVLDHVSDLREPITFTEEAYYDIDDDSSHMDPWPQVGETMTVWDCLQALTHPSCNVSSNALAIHVAGSVSSFTQMMNEKAASLGAASSHFSNPHGLDAQDHYTTAMDMAVIFRAGLSNPTFIELTGTGAYTIPATNVYPERPLHQADPLLAGVYPCEGIYAGKIGHTDHAQFTLLTACRRGHQNVLVCVMGDPEYESCMFDTIRLMDAGIAQNAALAALRQTSQEIPETETSAETEATSEQQEETEMETETEDSGRETEESAETIAQTEKENEEEVESSESNTHAGDESDLSDSELTETSLSADSQNGKKADRQEMLLWAVVAFLGISICGLIAAVIALLKDRTRR